MKNPNELKAGALLSYVNLAIGCIIPLLYTPIMLRILGQAEYGLYSLANSVISYLSLLNFGVGSVVVRFVTQYRAKNDDDGARRVLGLFVTIYSVLATIVFIGGIILASVSDIFFAEGLSASEIERLRILVVILATGMAITFPQSVFSSVAVAYEKFIFRRLLNIVSTIASPIINLAVLVAGFGTIGMAIGSTIGQFCFTFIFLLYCKKKLGIYPIFHQMPTQLLRELFGYCAFVFLATIVDLLYWSTDKVLIGARLGSAAVAVYNIGGVFTSMLQNMSSSISNVFTPRVTTLVVKDASKQEISDLLIRVGRIQFLIVSFILSGYIVFGRPFINLWAGSGYMDAYPVALLTMIPLAVPLIQSIAFSTIMAQNKHQFRAIVYAIIAVINVISTYIVLPYWGIIGAAACTGIAYTVGNGLIMNNYYYRVTKLDIPCFWKNILRMAIIPLATTLIAWPIVNVQYQKISPLSFLLGVVIYSILFFTLAWKFMMNEYERGLICGMLQKIPCVGKRIVK